MAPIVLGADCWDKDGDGGIDIHPECMSGSAPVEPPEDWHPQSIHDWSQEDVLVVLGVSVAAVAVVGGSVTGKFYCNQVDIVMRPCLSDVHLQWYAVCAGTG